MKNKGLRAMSALLALVMLLLCLPFSLVALATGEEAPSAPEELKTLDAYRHASVQTKDNTVGLTVNVHTYYDEEKEKTYTVSTQGVEGTPVIFYVMNTNTKRLGTKTDAELVSSFLTRGYFVLVLDYLKSSDAVSPALDLSIQDIRSQVIGGKDFTGTKSYTSGTYTDGVMKGLSSDMAIAYVLPAGYDIAYRIPYFSYDLHGAAGTLERIVEVWNNDFKSVHRKKLVKWVDENDLPRLTKTEALTKQSTKDTSSIDYATWFKDANGNGAISEATLKTLTPQEQKAYPYTYIGNTKVTSVTDCVKPDGTFIDLNLYMDVFYPSGETEKVPVMVCMASTYTRAAMLSVNTRPQMTGFLFSGYAGVVSDYGLVPMCRNDHYGYFCGNSQINSVSGDNYTYSLSVFNGIKSDSAMLRTIRKMAVDGITVEGSDETLTFNFLPDKIGIYGNSKSGTCIRFANPNPERLSEIYQFEGHLGESRLEAKNDASYGYTDPYIGEDGKTTDEKIRLPEGQPYLTYKDGTVISSQANLVYAQCGGSSQAIVKGSAPIFATGTQKQGGDGCSYWSFYIPIMNRCRSGNVPFFGLVSPDVGHDFGYGEDQSYGIDTYYAFHRYANYHLQNGNAECMVIDVDTINDIGADNQKEIDHVYEINKDSSVKLAFTGPVDRSEIAKVKIVNAITGEDVLGQWSGSYGDQQWKFLPTSLEDGTYYRVIVPATILAKNNKPLKEEKSLTFRTASGATLAAASVEGATDVITDTAASYVTFDTVETKSAHRTELRFAVENDASNTVIVSAAPLSEGQTYGDVTEWKELGEVVLVGAGVYTYDVTDFVRSASQTRVIFRLQAKYAGGDTELRTCDMESGGVPSGFWFTWTAKPSVSEGAKNEDKSDNRSLKLEYMLRNSAFINLENELCGNVISNPYQIGTLNYWMNGNGGISAADYGRTFRISFRIFDETSRLLNVAVGNEVNSANLVTDAQNYVSSFYTKAGEWMSFSIEFRIDDPMDWEYLNKASVAILADNKSIAVLDPLATVHRREMASDSTTRPDNYAGSAGLKDTYIEYENAAAAEAAGAVTVNKAHTAGLYFDDFVFEELHTSVELASGVAPVLSVKPMDTKDALPVQATYVTSSEPDDTPASGTLLVGGGEKGADSLSVKSYVQLSLDGYSGKTAALLFRASGKNSTIHIYGVADIAAGQAWTKSGITAANAPANDRYSSGVKLDEVWGGAPLATFTVNGEGEEFAIDLTDFAREMYEAGASAVTLIFVSASDGGTSEIKVLDFNHTYTPLTNSNFQGTNTLKYAQKADSEGNQVLEIYPEAATQDKSGWLFGGYNNDFLPIFTDEYIGRTIRITFRAKANVANSEFEIGMMSARPRTTAATKEDGTSDKADTENYYEVPYLSKTCKLDKADEWQTFTFEFTVDASMTQKYVTHWGKNHWISVNNFAIRAFNMNPYKNDSFADKVAHAEAIETNGPSVVLSVDDLVAEEVTGSTTITLIDKEKGTLVSDKGYNGVGISGFGKQTAEVASGGYGKSLIFHPAADTQAPNANQSIQISGLVNADGKFNAFKSENVGKTYRITFTASASEEGMLDLGFTAVWASGAPTIHNMTDGVLSQNYRNVFYPNAQSTVRLTPTARTYSFEFTVVDGMLPENLVKTDGTVSGSSLAFAIKAYNGFYRNGGYTDGLTITLDNFLIYEVQRSAYAEIDSDIRVADFESGDFGASPRYFETRYMNEDDESPVFRDTFGRLEDAENAHGGSYVMALKSTRVNNLPYFTKLLPTSYTAEERGNTYSVSFWMKASKTGNFKIALTCAGGDGAKWVDLDKLDQPQSFTVTEANVYKRYTYTYTVGDAQLAEDRPAVYLAIHPFAMGQSSEF